MATIIGVSVLIVIFIIFTYVAMSTERKEVDTFPLKIKIFFHKKVLPVLLIVGWGMGTVHFCDILNHFGIRGVLEVIYAIAFFGIMVYAFYYVSKDK